MIVPSRYGKTQGAPGVERRTQESNAERRTMNAAEARIGYRMPGAGYGLRTAATRMLRSLTLAYTVGLVRSQLPWPFLPGVEDSDDFEAVAAQPVGNDVRCAWYDQLSGACNTATTTEIGQFSEVLDSFEQSVSDSVGGRWIVARDMRAEVCQMFDGSRRPDDGHTRGAFRSRLRPHERSQSATSLCGTP